MLTVTLVSEMYYIIWTLFLLFCLHCILWSLFWRARLNFRNLPSFPQLPFLGCIHWFIGGGPIISDPDDVKKVNNNILDKPYFYDFSREWIANGLLTAPGDIWKRNIKFIAGTFNGSMVDGFQQVFNTTARELVEKLKEESNKQLFDPINYLYQTTLAAICHTGLGITYKSDSEKSQVYYEAFKGASELLFKRGLNVFYHYDCFYRFSSDHAKYLEYVSLLHNISNTVINQKIQERKELAASQLDVTIEGSKKSNFRTVLDVLLDIKEKNPYMDLNHIRSEVQTIIIGGQDTIATTLQFVLLMLGSHPDVQNKLYDEIKQIFEGDKTDLTKEDLPSLIYCEAVIQETLRLFPSFPIVTRHADRDVQIKSCTIPKGTMCSLNIWGAGRSRRAWGEDAEKFVPERWFEPLSPQNLSYMPFSIARRSCIGKKYAMAILKTLVAYCVKHLIFVSDDDKLELKLDITLRPAKGNLLGVKLRV